MSTEIDEKAGFVKFQQFHQPTLAVGDYEIAVEQSVKIVGHQDIIPFIASKYFTVAGERFELKPTDVHSVFPPDGNLGEHFKVLPHLILNRSTLPWERTAESYAKGEQKQATGTPWLALLLFDENEKPEPLTVKASVLADPPSTPSFPKLELETAQHGNDEVTVIDVPRSVLETIMPTVDELKLSAHVRFGSNKKGKAIGDELAVIIGNRLPQLGKTSTAHLVSVEGRFAKGTGAEAQKYVFNYQGASENDLIRLVSLKRWSFACEDKKKGFKELLIGLNQQSDSIATLRLPSSGVQDVEKLLSKGYVPIPHYLRHGDHTASFFHGPFMPGQNTSPAMALPARSSDELVRYDPAISMFDVSYAAAWEMGRLLALQDKDFSTSLYQWKRQRAQLRAQRKQRLAHLPFQNLTRTLMPKTIEAWFKRLRQLEGVPFNYLVPDERMLPAESIRFFRVDRAWVDCLADGAFSIGRVASSDHQADKLLGETSPAAGDDGSVTGFLLRSEVASGWPGLLVEAYSDLEAKGSIGLLRMERLDAGVLLCLFAGVIARVDIHQKPETLHFGLDERPQGGFYKYLRDAKGARLNVEVDVETEHWRPNSKTILNIAALARSMNQKLNPTAPPLTSAQFGLQMVEGVERIIFLSKKTT